MHHGRRRGSVSDVARGDTMERHQNCEICKRRRLKADLGVAFCVDGSGREIVRCNDNDRCRHIAKVRAVQSRPVVEK